MNMSTQASEAHVVLAKIGALGVMLIVTASTISGQATRPRDERQFLQSLIDGCPTSSVCELPAGFFTISAPPRSTQIRPYQGRRRRAPGRKPDRPMTRIRVAAGARAPAFTIEGMDGDIQVGIKQINVVGGEIFVGGPKEPCRGIDDPFDRFQVDLTLEDTSIAAGAFAAIKFEGDSLALQDVEVVGNDEGTGLYVANATGDIVIQDAEFDGTRDGGSISAIWRGAGKSS